VIPGPRFSASWTKPNLLICLSAVPAPAASSGTARLPVKVTGLVFCEQWDAVSLSIMNPNDEFPHEVAAQEYG
jgi:hypothetical protein